MPAPRCYTTFRLVNGSTGDPVLYVDTPGRDNAILFDAGDNSALSMGELADLDAVFISHHHVDHFIGLDRIVRANLDRDKTLQIFGPEQTIQKVYDRIRSYEYQFFPFQKIVLRVHEILPETIRTALLECTQRFPEPAILETPRAGRVVYENSDARVEAVHVDHTVTCLAYALVEKEASSIDLDKVQAQGLIPGSWLDELKSRLESSGSLDAPFTLPNGDVHALRDIQGQLFSRTPGARIAFVTDTAWSVAVRPKLQELCRGAWRLYCDCFYAREQAAQAAKHRHMTTDDAAELAKSASVDQIVLIHFAARYVGDYARLLDQVRQSFPNATAEMF
jgi:ribonuclease Z